MLEIHLDIAYSLGLSYHALECEKYHNEYKVVTSFRNIADEINDQYECKRLNTWVVSRVMIVQTQNTRVIVY